MLVRGVAEYVNATQLESPEVVSRGFIGESRCVLRRMSGKEVAALWFAILWFFTILGVWIGASIEKAERGGNPHLKYLLGFWGLCILGFVAYALVVY